MATQHEKRIEIAALLHASVPRKDIAEQTGASLRTIYNISKHLEAGDDLRHSPGAGRKATVSTAQVKAAFKRKLNRSIAETARKLNKSTSAVSRALKKAGGCSLCRIKHPLLTSHQQQVCLEHAKKLLNSIKNSLSRIIIFSDEKTFTVDLVFNRQNDQVVSFGNLADEHRYVSTTKHPASVMMLGLVASNGAIMDPVWFSEGYRLTADAYVKILATKVLPWIKSIVGDSPWVF